MRERIKVNNEVGNRFSTDINNSGGAIWGTIEIEGNSYSIYDLMTAYGDWKNTPRQEMLGMLLKQKREARSKFNIALQRIDNYRKEVDELEELLDEHNEMEKECDSLIENFVDKELVESMLTKLRGK